jgi:hypothetical protein
VKKTLRKILCFFVGHDWHETDDSKGHDCYVCGAVMAGAS